MLNEPRVISLEKAVVIINIIMIMLNQLNDGGLTDGRYNYSWV